ncbi:high-affinity Fe2+/Pb2+ permease [Streptococcus pneumoniae]|nr:high-affinity Fe2+/Pb2+ permease [Streptococcus pneumoniae]
MASDFERVENKDSEVGKIVKEKLALSGDITEAKLTEISSALLAFEKEQMEKVREAFKKMNSTWTINESVVRDNSTAHYGRVETAISFLPSSMETEPTDESGT